jgi:serine phosphatase RsbU (regulator of sigma subunit)/CHASE2 domain-containing sensor protein
MRLLGAGVALALAAASFGGAPWQHRLQLAWFDSYQTLASRTVRSMPAVIVEIDEKSLTEIGQWPWPRTETARLINRIAEQSPAAIGIDLLWPEPDRLSPGAIARTLPTTEAVTRDRLLALPSNDALLASSIARAPVVLAIAGAPQATRDALRAPPFRLIGSESMPPVRSYEGVLTSLAGIDRAAAGHGLISTDIERGVVRRMPLVASVAGALVPGLELEMLRVATGTAAIALHAEGGVARQVAVKGFAYPVEADGAAWLHFSPRDPRRFVSAADVMAGRVPREKLESKLVLIGITGLGLLDYQTVTSGERMPGVEVHAQFLEMIFDATPLIRPRWAAGLEWLVYGAGAALLLWLVPALTPRRALAVGTGVIGTTLVSGWALFVGARVLFDAANPALNLVFVFGALLAASLVEANRRERALECEVQLQREEAARVAGELEAARRIQTGILPRPDALRADPRLEIAAEMTPAREVGGDLYDFFPLDRDRLFFLIGDVSGKGLPASIFMAVSKALYKSNVLRCDGAHTDLALAGELMTAANAEVSRENGEAMFVTLFAGILDLETGALAYCNAGHDNPALLSADGATAHLTDGDGPPLCVVDDFEYSGATTRLAPGDLLCLVTDGVTEAQNPAAALYGGRRLRAVQDAVRGGRLGAADLLKAVHADVARFVDGAEPADDLTILVLRWNGPAAAWNA